MEIIMNPDQLNTAEKPRLLQQLKHANEPKENKWIILQIFIEREKRRLPIPKKALPLIENILNDIFEDLWPWKPLLPMAARRLGFLGSRYALSERSLDNLTQAAQSTVLRERDMRIASLEALHEIADTPSGWNLLNEERQLQIKDIFEQEAGNKLQAMVSESVEQFRASGCEKVVATGQRRLF